MRDDHILLAAEELQMTAAIKAAQIAGKQPAVNDGLRSQLGIVEVMRHYGFAPCRHFSNAFRIRIQHTQLDPGQRLPDSIGTERLQIVERERRACFS